MLALAWFTALVWLDSAAFFIIQNSPVLKAGAWQGDAHLWRTGLLHLAAAMVSAWLLARRGFSITLGLALAALGAACFLLLDPARVPVAAFLYPIGVSLYSVALVAYPSFLMTTGSQAVRARSAGYLYAIAGWIGSAMGIGMGQNLHHVPQIVCGRGGGPLPGAVALGCDGFGALRSIRPDAGIGGGRGAGDSLRYHIS